MRILLITLFYVQFAWLCHTQTFGADKLLNEKNDNWKLTLISECNKSIQDIQSKPDDEMFRSCIAVSHFENLIELVSQVKQPTDRIKNRYKIAIMARTDFENGKCPNLSIGKNKLRYIRFPRGKIEEFVVSLPQDFSPETKSALYLHVDNRRWAAKRDLYPTRSGFVDMWWHTVSNKNINWKNFDTFIKILRNKINIDFDRIYLNGECGNGLSAISMALQRPDYWAHVSASMGNTYRYLAGNAFNLPLIFVRGGHKEQRLVSYYDFAVKCFEFFDCKNFLHSKEKSTSQLMGSKVPQTLRIKKPKRVKFTCDDLSNASAYWLEILGRTDENFPGSVDARIDGSKMIIATENVDAYKIHLADTGLDSAQPVKIYENEKFISICSDKIFIKRSKKYDNAKYIKNPQLSGPIGDAFTDPFVFVYDETGQYKNQCRELAKKMKSSDLIIDQNSLNKDIIANNNLIIFGTPEKNLLLKKIFKELPIKFVDGNIVSDNFNLQGSDIGFILIHPNPLNINKYVVVMAAGSERSINFLPRILNKIKDLKLTD